MVSPFPGMDPYLEDEKLWPLFQHQLVTCLYQNLLPGLVERYRARVGLRSYTTEHALFTSVVTEVHREEFIEIRLRGDGRLVTLIDIVSPTNKTRDLGRRAYLENRQEARNQGANLVEIDLVMQGQPMLEYSRETLEGLPEWDHLVTITRDRQSERPEIYLATLQKKLPRFRFPLAEDRATLLDLQAAFTRSFEQGGFAAKVDYTRDPPTTLSDEARVWIAQVLKQHKLR